MGGFVLGPFYGFAAGLISPLLSALLTGMPPWERLPFMMLELGAYGCVCGALYPRLKKKAGRVGGCYLTLFGAMAAGRVVYALALFVAAELLGIAAAGPIAALDAVVTGLYGIVIQIVFIPPVVILLERSGLLDRFNRTGGKA